ncbi:hypothetical protein H4R34_001498 [Dimargaris verticillata]|uniref:Jacalin-type lectin domain-containing protein n=1 Tax=Dimargaris verticillata TaxID=2761393 RepID=A0A9W8B3I1_9FUNG|nr:hypothetical protein H4R34_001498 [Dimargaris verticillata]
MGQILTPKGYSAPSGFRVSQERRVSLDTAGLRDKPLRVLLLYGRAGQPNTSFEDAVTVTSATFPTQVWPVVDSHFKCLVPLESGQNVLRFHFQGADMYFTVHYLPPLQSPPMRLVVMLAKDSPQVFDAPPNQQAQNLNTLSVAVKKLRCAAYLWQALTAEQMQRHGFGRRTFRLDETWLPDSLTNQSSDQRNTAQVYIARARVTTAEMREPERAQQYNPPPGTPKSTKDNMFALFAQALDDYGAPFDQPCYVVGLILDSHWDPQQSLIVAHAALGGGRGNRRQGVFGSHCTHAWPSCLEEVVPAFLDTTKTDESILANDAKECGEYWRAANIGMGAFLHEAGHMLTLSHTPTGLMSRGFNNFNRTFMVKEPGLQPIAPADEAGSHWHRVDVVRFRYHPCFRRPIDPPPAPPGSGTECTFYPVTDGLLLQCPVGISMVEMWVNGRYRAHIEYSAEFPGKVYTPAGPQTQVRLQHTTSGANLITPCLVTLTLDDLRQMSSWKDGENVKLEVVTTAQAIESIDHFETFPQRYQVTLPYGDSVGGIPALKSVQFGRGEMKGTTAFATYFASFSPQFPPPAVPNDGPALPFLSHLRIYHGRYIDGLTCSMSDGTWVQCGNAKGNPIELALAPGEGLACINVRSGFWIDAIEVVTTTGRTTGWLGNATGGGLRVLKPPVGYQWAGIYGSCAAWLDALGCFYTKV